MKVEPFIDMKDVKSIKKLLKDNPRDRLLFIMGINSGLRCQDILSLRVADVLGVKVGDRIGIKEKKTGKDNVLIINKEIMDAITGYLGAVAPEPEHFLFKSRKGKNYPLTTFAVTKAVKSWAAALNLVNHNYGAVSLRKTWVYHQRKSFGVSWEVIAKRLNHSSPAITRRYLGIQEEEVEEILMNTI